MKLRKHSLVWKMARIGGMPRWTERTDICELFWRLFGVALIGTFLIFVLGMIAFVLIVVPLLHVFNLLWDMNLLRMAGAGWIVIGCFALAGLIVWGLRTLINWRMRRKHDEEPRPPGFIRTAYRAWKDKTCVFVDIVEERE